MTTTMSTQAYYKDRLGFDPAEALNDGSTFDKSKQGYEENLSKFKGLWDFFIESIGTIMSLSKHGVWECSSLLQVADSVASNAQTILIT